MRKYILPILLALIITTACSPKELEQPPLYKVIPHGPDHDSGYTVKDGTLHFNSESNFFDLATKIAAMGDKEFNEFCLKTGFNSYRTKLYNEELEYEKTVTKIIEEAELNNTKAVIAIEEPKPEIVSHFYRSIIDINGVFYVNGIKNIVKGTEVEGYKPSNTKSNAVLIGRASYLMSEEQTRSSSTHNYNLNSAICATRKAITQPIVYQTIYYSGNTSYSAYTLEIFMDARKGRSGNWNHYSTTYQVNNLMFNGKIYPFFDSLNESIHHTFVITTTSSYNVHAFTYKYATRGTISHGYGTYDKTQYDQEEILPNANSCI